MPYGIRLKKIMRVITRVPVGDYLIIILLGISSSLLEMDKLDCIRQTSPSLPLTNHVTLEKSFQFYAFSVLKFYSSTCCDKDNCEEPLRHRGGWSPQPQQSPCSGLSASGWWNEMPGRFMESLPLLWKNQTTRGARVILTDIWAGVAPAGTKPS